MYNLKPFPGIEITGRPATPSNSNNTTSQNFLQQVKMKKGTTAGIRSSSPSFSARPLGGGVGSSGIVVGGSVNGFGNSGSPSSGGSGIVAIVSSSTPSGSSRSKQLSSAKPGGKNKLNSLSSSIGTTGSGNTNSSGALDPKVTSPKPNSSPLIHFFSSTGGGNSKRSISSAGNVGDHHAPMRNSFSVNATGNSGTLGSLSNKQPLTPLGRKKDGERRDFQSLSPSSRPIAPLTLSNKQPLTPITASHYVEDEEEIDVEASYITPHATLSKNSFDVQSTTGPMKQYDSISPTKVPLLSPPPIPKNKLNLQYRIKKANNAANPNDPNGGAATSEKALKVSVYSKQKPMCDESTHPTGEDAYYCCYSTKHEVYSFGIADGVGGWMAFEIDPSLVSRQLMWNCKMLLCADQINQIISENNYTIPKEYESTVMKALELPQVIHPKILLERAFRLMTELNQVKAGGTTACVLFLKPLPQNLYQLSYANLGDSGFAVVNKQKNKVIYRTKEQQHYFNAPYQLSIIPPELDSDELIKDDPSSADLQINCCTLREGDFIILATDGLFDNLFDQDILKIMKAGTSCHSIAKKLVQEAVKRYSSQNLPIHTPFSMGLSKMTGEFKRHGKSDDVTVCCVSVCCN
ncbi:predicted protein [Naegleria gruberi]|uniref:Protein phosphatase n=1 Tax=Naegleria gruberi TaxID=5762 RepID=D2VM13_NAEGR|nr:uncharacterized protein NAEGRDRAFT_80499 [Naegleria gruberi]EFC42241.1 predicted protein [Naegleria gruberi]|eukprot:XP_002674985.1 predicted protein [Naegleria gruberi strain NEG-M]